MAARIPARFDSCMIFARLDVAGTCADPGYDYRLQAGDVIEPYGAYLGSRTDGRGFWPRCEVAHDGGRIRRWH